MSDVEAFSITQPVDVDEGVDPQVAVVRNLRIIHQIRGSANSSLDMFKAKEGEDDEDGEGDGDGYDSEDSEDGNDGKQGKASKHGEDGILKVLDWLALIFVRTNHGDVVAVALKIDPDVNETTLFISQNRGVPAEEDKEAGRHFICTLGEVLLGPALSLSSKLQLLKKFILERTSVRIQRKVYMLNNKLKTPQLYVEGKPQLKRLPPKEYLLKLISEWQARGEEETSAALVSWASRNECCSNATDALKACVTQLLDIKAHDKVVLFPLVSPQDSLELFDKILRLVNCLLGSTYFRRINVAWRKPENRLYNEDCHFVMHLQRRLQRVLRYATHALQFLIDIVPRIQDALGPTGLEKLRVSVKSINDGLKDEAENGGFKICWAGGELDKAGLMPAGHDREYSFGMQRPQDFVKCILRTISPDHFPKNSDGQEEPSTAVKRLVEGNADLGRSWNHRGTVRPFWHCELQLITFLQENRIDLKSPDGIDRIGVSKLSCDACAMYMEEQRKEDPSSEYELSGESKKAHHAWAIPKSNESVSNKVVRRIREARNAVLVSALTPRVKP